jgi:hypothetical protein
VEADLSFTGASFTKLTSIFGVSFGNFLLHKTNNFVLQKIIFIYEGQAKSTVVNIK